MCSIQRLNKVKWVGYEADRVGRLLSERTNPFLSCLSILQRLEN